MIRIQRFERLLGVLAPRWSNGESRPNGAARSQSRRRPRLNETRGLQWLVAVGAAVACAGGTTDSTGLHSGGQQPHLEVTLQPQFGASGQTLMIQPQVALVDSTGATVTTVSDTVTASIASGTGTLAGTTKIFGTAGVATFTDLKVTGTGDFTLKFATSVPDLQVTSTSFTVYPQFNFVTDTRAGGANSIQNANSLAEATAASGWQPYENCLSGNCNGVGFSTNIDGKGLHGWRWEVKQNGGNPNGCIQGGPSEHDWMLYTQSGHIGSFGKTTYLQYTVWAGRTQTGGGIGPIGSYNFGGGHKYMVWFRDDSVGNQGRITAVGVSDIMRHKFDMDPVNSQPGTGVGADPRANIGPEIWSDDLVPNNGVQYSENNFLNRPMIVTYVIRTESAIGAKDGLFQYWLNNVRVMNVDNFAMSTVGFGQAEVGGPTWICPPADQTAYYYNVAMWWRP